MHTCPVGECPETVADHLLMCGRHWRLVPADIGRRLYRAWRGGAGAGTDEHTEAMAAAIAAVEERLEGAGR